MTPTLNGRMQEPPVEWPTITIGGITLTVRFDFYAEYALENLGLKMADVLGLFKQDLLPDGQVKPKEHLASTAMRAFAAMVALEYPEGAAPTADFWARQIAREQPRRPKLLGEVFEVILRAVLKAPRAAAPAPTQPARATPAPTLELPN
jgi:hypothetical protein